MPDNNENHYGGNFEKDRTVPPEENYYGHYDPDQNFGRREINRENDFFEYGINPAEEYNAFSNPIEDFDRAPEQKDRQSVKKKKQRKVNPLVAVLAVFLAIVLLAAGLTVPVLGKISYNKKVPNEYISSSELVSSSKVTNILLLGVDARANEESSESRSDSMMLISIDSENNCIKMTSFLRDTWVYIPCKDKSQRLNAACAYGGYSAVADTIEYNFGVEIDGYVVADFEMFKIMVDSIGGVEIDVTQAEAKEVTNHPKRYGGVKLESGVQKLTGEQALAYCRIRKIDTDWKRTERQRIVMEKIISGIFRSGPISAYATLTDIAPCIETNLSKTQLVGAGFKALGCVSGGFKQASCPFDGTWNYTKKGGASVIGIDEEKNKEKLIEFIYGE